MTIEALKSLIEAKNNALKASRLEGDALEAEYLTALQDACKAKLPRKRPGDLSACFKILGEDATEIRVGFEVRAKALIDARKEAERAFHKEAAALADAIPVQSTGGGWQAFSAHYPSTYASQGFGADRYTLGAAQRDLARCEAGGLEALIEAFSTGDAKGYKVMVRCDEDTLLVLMHRSPLPIRETVRLCWANGTNPRVYYPMLPHSFEAENGLDHFGGEIARSPR